MSEEFDYESLNWIEDAEVREKFRQAMRRLEQKTEEQRYEAIRNTVLSIVKAIKKIQSAPALEKIRLAKKLQEELKEKREKLIVVIAYMLKPEYRPIVLEALDVLSK